jgi:hypothetical protein
MKQRRILSVAIASAMALGSTAMIATANPGPNGNNEKGLCTAYFNGQKNGHDNDRAGGNGNGNGRQPGQAPGPFAALEAAAEEADMSVYEYCMQFGIEGNPGQNGRFTECFDGDDSTGNDACPTDD